MQKRRPKVATQIFYCSIVEKKTPTRFSDEPLLVAVLPTCHFHHHQGWSLWQHQSQSTRSHHRRQLQTPLAMLGSTGGGLDTPAVPSSNLAVVLMRWGPGPRAGRASGVAFLGGGGDGAGACDKDRSTASWTGQGRGKKMADRWERVGVRTKVENIGVHYPVQRDKATERTRDDNAHVGGPTQKRIDVSCTRVERWTRRMESHDP
jgi:hypothetical protein